VLNSGWSDYGFLLRGERQVRGGILSVGWQSDLGRDIERPRSNSASVRFYYPYENSHRFTTSYEVSNVSGFERVKLAGLVGTYDQRTDQDSVPTAADPRSIERSDISARDFQVRLTADRNVAGTSLELGADANGRFGLEAHDINVSYDLAGAVVETTDNLSIDSARRTDTGLFLQAQRVLVPRLVATGGARVDVVRTVNEGGFFGDRSTSNGAASGFGSLTAGPFNRLTFTGQVSRGFRDPTLSDRYFRGPTGRGFITGNPDLDPETSLQFDFSVRYSMSRVRLATYVYHYRIADLVERFEDETDFFFFRNRGRARINGVEVEAQADLGRGFALEVNGQFSRGRALDDDTALDDIAPPSVGFVLRRALTDRGTAYIRLVWYAEDTRPGPSEIDAPGFTDVDAGASWRLVEHLELRAAARNLLNEQYYASPDRRFVLAPGRSAALTAVISY
jgi:outer membrane receptor protein involved in Fe transport